jgi:organic hydroperoxide reductase OsmC/OhrA
MAEHGAKLVWNRDGADFLNKRYSRRHTLLFDGGLEIPGSASPTIVPEPMSDPSALDPEEAFVASIASCHLLWFLAIAAEQAFCVDSYRDSPTGSLDRDADGRLAMTEVVLRPEVLFSGDSQPTGEQLLALHHAAHERCFIANSVRTVVRCEPLLPDAR